MNRIIVTTFGVVICILPESKAASSQAMIVISHCQGGGIETEHFGRWDVAAEYVLRKLPIEVIEKLIAEQKEAERLDKKYGPNF